MGCTHSSPTLTLVVLYHYVGKRSVNLRNLQNALRNYEIVHAQFANFCSIPDPNPNPDTNLNRDVTLAKSRSAI